MPSPSAQPESTASAPRRTRAQPRGLRENWLFLTRVGFQLAFAGGVVIVLGLLVPNGTMPSALAQLNPPPSPPEPPCRFCLGDAFRGLGVGMAVLFYGSQAAL